MICDSLFLPDLVIREHPINDREFWWLSVPGLEGTQSFYDIMGSNRGALVNGPQWTGSRGRPGGWGSLSLEGAGSGHYVDLQRHWQTDQITFGLWVMPLATEGFGYIFYQGNVYNLLRRSGNIAYEWASQQILGSAPVGTWVRAIATQQGAVGRLYLNGRQVGTANGDPPIPQTNHLYTLLGSGNLPPSFSTQFLADDVFLSTRTWSAAEVQEDYDQSCRGSPDLLRRYRPKLYLHVAEAPPTGFKAAWVNPVSVIGAA